MTKLRMSSKETDIEALRSAAKKAREEAERLSKVRYFVLILCVCVDAIHLHDISKHFWLTFSSRLFTISY